MWEEQNNTLVKCFEFQNFIQAFLFMTEMAFHIEKLNHHPEWKNTYNKIEVQLRTHDAGNIITDKDRELAQIFDTIYSKHI